MNNFFKNTILNSHATIVEIPRGYGFDFALKKIDFPKEIQVIKFEPTIHGTQKTESINVEDIETLQEKVKVKSVKKRCFVFINAEKMNEAAQNKFLKIFEEPTKNTSFLLLTENKNAFEKTILSRAQILRIPPISPIESLNMLKKTKLDDQDKQKILFLADGLPGEIEKLSNSKRYFNEQIENAEIAKRWFTGSRFDKILIIKILKSDRDKTLKVLEILLKITSQTFTQSPKENALKTREILNAFNRISKNGNVSLILLRVAMV
jgi:DNA polymerase III, delta' subunit